MRPVVLIICCAMALPCWAQPGQDAELLSAEQHDALLREQQELRARTKQLQSQQQTTQAILEQQDAYLDALQARIDELKARDEEADTARKEP